MEQKFKQVIEESINKNLPTFQQLWDLIPDEVSIPNWKRGENAKRVNIKKELEDTIQDSKHHPEGSVFTHMRLIYNQIVHNFANDPDLPYLILALIFHDIAKPETVEHSFRPDGTKKITHIGHEYVATKYMDVMLAQYVDRLKHAFPQVFAKTDKDIDFEMVRNIVKDHMRMHLYIRALDGTNLQSVNLGKQKWTDFKNSKHFEATKKFSAGADDHGRYRELTDEEAKNNPEVIEDDATGKKLGYVPKDYDK